METNISRNKEHEYIMITIFDCLTLINMGEEIALEGLLEGIFGLEYTEIPVFSKEIVIKSIKNINDIIATFQEKMPKWKFDRLNLVEQAILIMSYAEAKYASIEKGVVIDNGVKLSKKYLDRDDYKFVNAILDNVL